MTEGHCIFLTHFKKAWRLSGWLDSRHLAVRQEAGTEAALMQEALTPLAALDRSLLVPLTV